MPGKLYLVATPIGNLQDISFRAVETLGSVGLIACEDTRHTRKLLNAYNISNKLVSYHEHNETERAAELIELITAGTSVAIVSDAGTPGINDPGFAIVRLSIEAGIDVVPISGPAAFVSAAVISGLPTDSIFFGGFLPSRRSERRRRLSAVAEVPATLVFYESPHRVAASLVDCAEILGERNAALARELTKMHEDVIRGTLSELAERMAAAQLKGEFVMVIDRLRKTDVREGTDGSAASAALFDRVNELQIQGADQRTALKTAAKEFGLTRSEAYRRLQTEKEMR